jgi:hypothetical protein
MKTHASDNSREWTNDFMDDCHEMARKHLAPYVGKMFENCNLAMLEFADKAESNTSQIRFMEAGNIIRRNRDNIESSFFASLQQGFTRFKQACNRHGTHSQPATFNTDISEDQMTLISKDDTDIQVAIQNMVASASLGSTLELTGIRQRLSVLSNGRKLEENQIPAGPHALASAFHKAAEGIVLEHESRLIVYLLFDRFVLSNTAALYEQYNNKLLKAGLLQNLKYEARKNPNTPQKKPTVSNNNQQFSSETGGNGQGPGQSLGDELFDSILSLMSQRNPHINHKPANPVQQTEIVSAIHAVQQKLDNRDTQASPDQSSEQVKHSVEHLVANLSAEREQLFNGVDRRRIPVADTQVIDLVGMMFEYMLNDADIPNVAKAELSRLHTPYLKVAIMDRTFFSDNEHTAHILLNELAQAGAHWVFEEAPERGIFPCIRKIVARIIFEFVNDLNIFNELLETLRSNIDDLEVKANRIEEHSRQAAEGKEKLELARLCADTAITELVKKYTVPAAIRQMLGDTWNDKLTFIFLREPNADQSDSWRLALQTIESILWCTEPKTKTEEQAALRECSLDTHKQIQQSLDTLSAYGASDIAADMSLVRAYTHAAFSSLLPGSSENSSLEEAVADEAGGFDQGDCPAANDNPPPRQAGIFAEYMTDQADEQTDTPSGEDTINPETITAMEALDTVPFGTWFMLRMDEEQPAIQAKLSWHSHISGNYMFVDSMGKRTAVLHRGELVRLMISGRAETIEPAQRPFVQRALEKIRRVLGGEKATQA